MKKFAKMNMEGFNSGSTRAGEEVFFQIIICSYE